MTLNRFAPSSPSSPQVGVWPDRRREHASRLHLPATPTHFSVEASNLVLGCWDHHKCPRRGLLTLLLMVYDILASHPLLLPVHHSLLSTPFSHHTWLASQMPSMSIRTMPGAMSTRCCCGSCGSCGHRSEPRGPSPCPLAVSPREAPRERAGGYSHSSSTTSSQREGSSGAHRACMALSEERGPGVTTRAPEAAAHLPRSGAGAVSGSLLSQPHLPSPTPLRLPCDILLAFLSHLLLSLLCHSVLFHLYGPHLHHETINSLREELTSSHVSFLPPASVLSPQWTFNQ